MGPMNPAMPRRVFRLLSTIALIAVSIVATPLVASAETEEPSPIPLLCEGGDELECGELCEIFPEACEAPCIDEGEVPCEDFVPPPPPPRCDGEQCPPCFFDLARGGVDPCLEDPFGSDVDSDGDKLTDFEQTEIYGTDPDNADTDGDGFNDRVELRKWGTDPLKADTDGDGFKDRAEVKKWGTDPLKADTDGDGFNDKKEVKKWGTDPLKADTDGDDLNDKKEIRKWGTDPLKADTDGDDLNDGDEIELGTDPLKGDTDGGGAGDGYEVQTSRNPLNAGDDAEILDSDEDFLTDAQEEEIGTDPFKKDTDGDRVSDFTEVENGTDPLKQDTDGGGSTDGEEIDLGTNPLDAGDDIVPEEPPKEEPVDPEPEVPVDEEPVDEEPVDEEPEQPAEPKEEEAPPAESTTYEVAAGDTLAKIAQRYGVSVKELLDANPGISNPNMIFPGEKLVMPAGAKVGPSVTVSAGDTIRSVAAANGVSVAELLAANPEITNPDLIVPGATIRIPSTVASEAAEGSVIVRSGDTLSGIAARHGHTLASVIAANSQIANPNLIYPGQRVNLPRR